MSRDSAKNIPDHPFDRACERSAGRGRSGDQDHGRREAPAVRDGHAHVQLTTSQVAGHSTTRTERRCTVPVRDQLGLRPEPRLGHRGERLEQGLLGRPPSRETFPRSGRRRKAAQFFGGEEDIRSEKRRRFLQLADQLEIVSEASQLPMRSSHVSSTSSRECTSIPVIFFRAPQMSCSFFSKASGRKSLPPVSSWSHQFTCVPRFSSRARALPFSSPSSRRNRYATANAALAWYWPLSTRALANDTK